MNYLRNRHEQLASFLREGIGNGTYGTPLPSTRVWARQLGIGRPTLLRALQVLAAEGLIEISKQGATLVQSKLTEARPAAPPVTKVVRILSHDALSGQFNLQIIRLSEQLQNHGIRLVVESCSFPRLKAIAAQAEQPWELCCLLSIPVAYQKYFISRKASSLVLGFTKPEIALPFMTPDLNGSIRHATNALLRQGFQRLAMLELTSKTAGVAQCIQTFEETCAAWQAHQVTSQVQLIWGDFTSMRLEIQRFVRRLTEPCGIVVHAPISLGVLVTSLIQHGIDIPNQVRIMALEHQIGDVQFSVPITHYGNSAEQYSRHILHAALHYFETGALPDIQKVLPMSEATYG